MPTALIPKNIAKIFFPTFGKNLEKIERGKKIDPPAKYLWLLKTKLDIIYPWIFIF